MGMGMMAWDLEEFFVWDQVMMGLGWVRSI